MNRMHWTVMEAMDLLAEAYLLDLGSRTHIAPDPIMLEALVRALDARPEMLEQVWQAWEKELIRTGWSQVYRDQAQYWLDAMVIGGIVMA